MRFAVVSYRVWSECCMISCYSIALEKLTSSCWTYLNYSQVDKWCTS